MSAVNKSAVMFDIGRSRDRLNLLVVEFKPTIRHQKLTEHWSRPMGEGRSMRMRRIGENVFQMSMGKPEEKEPVTPTWSGWKFGSEIKAKPVDGDGR